MAKRKRIQPEPLITPIEALMKVWKKYGAWIIGGVAAILVVVLVVNWITGHARSRLQEAQQELASLKPDDPSRLTRLQQLEHEYGDTTVAPRIRLELAWEYLKQRDYARAEPLLKELLAGEKVPDFFKLRAELGLAYAAADRGEYDQAKALFEKVGQSRLYAAEAKDMIETIDKAVEDEAEMSRGRNEAGNVLDG